MVPWRTAVAVSLCTLLLAGCGAPIATLYVGRDGAYARCERATVIGFGLIGLVAQLAADQARDNCIRDALTMGLRPLNGRLPDGMNVEPMVPRAVAPALAPVVCYDTEQQKGQWDYATRTCRVSAR